MIAVGVIALGGNILKNFIIVPLADLWVPALIIVAAGILPAFLIIVGSLIIWGEMEEKKIERGVIKIEKKLLSRTKSNAKKRGK
jgi:hypothetical protein